MGAGSSGGAGEVRPLVEQVRAVCRRLAGPGWGAVLGRHGLDLEADDLEGELLRDLPAIDRAAPGFEDFAAEGRRGIEPGDPARSLLLHALASPNVLEDPDGGPLGVFATGREL